jgi:hypothetical protein
MPAQRQRLGNRGVEGMTLKVVHVSETDQRARPQRSRRATSTRQCPFEPQPSLLEQAPHRPEPEERACKLDSLFGEGGTRQGPLERGSDVFLLRTQSPKARHLVVVTENWQHTTELVEEKLEMAIAHPIRGAALHEPVARKLTDRLEKEIPALSGDIAF